MEQEQAKAMFMELNRKVSSVALEFDRQQTQLQIALQQAIAENSMQAATQTRRRLAFFEGAWLPGPLSYPWLVVIASMPQLIEAMFRNT